MDNSGQQYTDFRPPGTSGVDSASLQSGTGQPFHQYPGAVSKDPGYSQQSTFQGSYQQQPTQHFPQQTSSYQPYAGGYNGAGDTFFQQQQAQHQPQQFYSSVTAQPYQQQQTQQYQRNSYPTSQQSVQQGNFEPSSMPSSRTQDFTAGIRDPANSAQSRRPSPPQPPQVKSQAQLNAEATILKSQSIVVPTMSQNMMEEFNTKNIERLGRMNLRDDVAPKQQQVPVNPFDSIPSNGQSDNTAYYQRNKDQEAAQLIGIISGYLKKRRESTNPCGMEPAQVDDVGDQIATITGQSWVGYWELLHGNLLGFLKSQLNHFTVINDILVVLKGFEYEVNFQQSQPLQSSQFPYQIPNDGNFAANLDPYYHDSQPPIYQHQQVMEPFVPFSAPSAPQPRAFHDDVHLQHSQPTYIPFFQDQRDQYPNIPFPHMQSQSAPTKTTSFDDGWVLFDDSSDLNAPIGNPFDFPSNSQSFSASGSAFQSSLNDSDNPLAIFEGASKGGQDNSDEEERKARKALRKEEKRKKKLQETEDELLARKLQEEEDTKLASQLSGVVAAPTTSAIGTRRVALTHPEIRELAETEIGKDNIRILAGFSVIKFGREGRPHQRKMWINSALTHLAWESAQFDGSHRGLELAKVVGIRIGEMTPTIRRSTKDLKKVKNLCLSLETQARTLDIQACSVIQRDALAAALKKVVEFNHNHKPHRVDKYRTELFL